MTWVTWVGHEGVLVGGERDGHRHSCKDESEFRSRKLCQKFKQIYLGDDLDDFLQLVDKDVVGAFMATGEQFKGIDASSSKELSRSGRLQRTPWRAESTQRPSTWS